MSHKLLVIGGTDLPLVESDESASSRINRQVYLLKSSLAATAGADFGVRGHPHRDDL
jgi:hypothetical protein